ncbi:hypothetical protein [Streptomyces sp. NRRL S-31]|uniref:hypothetical protein n=1 Tax=Streptomyces sp. NRRL S-31 TaxID=1463898 RepID=UPI0004C9EEC0|nr:hypothetical protein [Streptomyces sp. NRRL S-31]
MTAAMARWDRGVERWAPPLAAADLARIVERMRGWQPFDADALLDDTGDALDAVVPADGAALAWRLLGHLERLETIAVANRARDEDVATAVLLAQAGVLRSQALDADRAGSVGWLRRMGWTVLLLHEQLVAAGCVREAA